MMDHDDMRRRRGADAALDAAFFGRVPACLLSRTYLELPQTHTHTHTHPQWRSRGSVTVPCITLSVQYEVSFVLAVYAFLDTRGKDEKKGK